METTREIMGTHKKRREQEISAETTREDTKIKDMGRTETNERQEERSRYETKINEQTRG